ncbi:D-alanyl-D-alanine carboxypeptidase/D-alanyl-D-alanine-endopeptidase [Gephyromycinifex aptenodytis]|uniref:D-alanyl-D-alanine carboxypeptidase/D-alanyl-D-alanine-endopeptidase n=1 Tax=Gephyromycinifex aptenodytis TaxID=2716227 RepID=UPI0014479675|nr:D-alanyl-D-alanine carboxypeptidase [Gephyromycinifex aptenodytis]
MRRSLPVAALMLATAMSAVPTLNAAHAAPQSVANRTQITPGGMAGSLSKAASSRYLGANLSGIVIDESSGKTLWSHNAGRTRMPASTQKVITAYTALHSMSPKHQLVTRSYQSKAVPSNVYLKGAGDPSLTSAKLKTLAARSASALKAQGVNTVTVYGDASVFPAPTSATGWKSSYLTHKEVQHVRGLTLRGYRGSNGTLAAASTFATHLKSYGVNVRTVGSATAPAARRELSASWSAPVRELLGQMLRVSDNDYAEYFLRLSALEAGRYPTWSSSLAHQRAVLTETGVPLAGYRAYDGSGLSRSNRMPVRTLSSVVDKLWDDPATRSVAFAPSSMPRAGQSGTLRARFRSTAQRCATGRVLAKTGTLGDAVALAGVAKGSDGRNRVFVFIENGRSETSAVRYAMDTLATSVVGCS